MHPQKMVYVLVITKYGLNKENNFGKLVTNLTLLVPKYYFWFPYSLHQATFIKTNVFIHVWVSQQFMFCVNDENLRLFSILSIKV